MFYSCCYLRLVVLFCVASVFLGKNVWSFTKEEHRLGSFAKESLTSLHAIKKLFKTLTGKDYRESDPLEADLSHKKKDSIPGKKKKTPEDVPGGDGKDLGKKKTHPLEEESLLKPKTDGLPQGSLTGKNKQALAQEALSNTDHPKIKILDQNGDKKVVVSTGDSQGQDSVSDSHDQDFVSRVTVSESQNSEEKDNDVMQEQSLDTWQKHPSNPQPFVQQDLGSADSVPSDSLVQEGQGPDQSLDDERIAHKEVLDDSQGHQDDPKNPSTPEIEDKKSEDHQEKNLGNLLDGLKTKMEKIEKTLEEVTASTEKIGSDERVQTIARTLAQSISETLSKTVVEQISQVMNKDLRASLEKNSQTLYAQLSKKFSPKIHQKLYQDIGKQVSLEAVKTLGKELPEKISAQLSDELAKELSKNISEQLSQIVNEKLSAQLTDQIVPQVSKAIKGQLTESKENSQAKDQEDLKKISESQASVAQEIKKQMDSFSQTLQALDAKVQQIITKQQEEEEGQSLGALVLGGGGVLPGVPSGGQGSGGPNKEEKSLQTPSNPPKKIKKVRLTQEQAREIQSNILRKEQEEKEFEALVDRL
jgi:hypothetical protein